MGPIRTTKPHTVKEASSICLFQTSISHNPACLDACAPSICHDPSVPLLDPSVPLHAIARLDPSVPLHAIAHPVTPCSIACLGYLVTPSSIARLVASVTQLAGLSSPTSRHGVGRGLD